MQSTSIARVTYKDMLALAPNFVSLDISVHATGWVKWYNGRLTHGVYAIQAEPDNDLGRRMEFRNFLRDLMEGQEFAFVAVEDVIGSINFKTAKILYQLNPIVDDLISDGEIKAEEVIRVDNNWWKMMLRKVSGFVPEVRGSSEVKKNIQHSLHLLEFGSPTHAINEGEYDAMGLAIAVIYSKYVLKESEKPKKLKKDISKVYKIKQYSTLEKALTFANKKENPIYQVDFSDIKRDLKYNFTKLITELNDDSFIFVITIPTSKMGAIALQKKLDLDIDISYLVVTL